MMSKRNSTIPSQVLTLSGNGPEAYNSYADRHADHPLAAWAELVDNSLEAGAREVTISKDDNIQAFVLQDDGIGLDRASMMVMVKFSATQKQAQGQTKTNYGLGFKQGAMGIAEEALVFSKTEECSSCGSTDAERLECFRHCKQRKRRVMCLARMSRNQTFQSMKRLVASQNDSAQVPLLFWSADGELIIDGSTDPPYLALDTAVEGAPLKLDKGNKILETMTYDSRVFNLKGIQDQFDKIPGARGTRILLWKPTLKDTSLDIEPDLDSNAPLERKDIVIVKKSSRPPHHVQHFALQEHARTFPRCSEPMSDVYIDYSLRSYLELLYRSADGQRLPFTISLFGKEIDFQRVEFRFHRDDVSPRYIRTMSFEAKLRHRDNETKEFSVKFGYSREDDLRDLAGTFIYYSKCSEHARGEGLRDRSCCPPLRLVRSFVALGKQRSVGTAGVASASLEEKTSKAGLIGIVEVGAPHFTIDQGKQKFVEGLDDIYDGVSRLISRYNETFSKARKDVNEKFRELAEHGLEVDKYCLVQGKWLGVTSGREAKVPCRIVNKWDRMVLREVADVNDTKENPMDKVRSIREYLVEGMQSGVKRVYGWVRVDKMEPYDSSYAPVSGALQRAKKTAEESMEQDWVKYKKVDWECDLCDEKRTVKLPMDQDDEQPRAWECSMGYWLGDVECRQCGDVSMPEKESKPRASVENGVARTAARSAESHIEEVRISELAVLRELGTGSQATCKVVKRDSKEWAAKFFHQEGSSDTIRTYLRELSALASLTSCENVVRIVGKQTGGQPAILMEKCDWNMQQLIGHGSEVSLFNFLLLARQIATGMKRVYACKIVHADLKLTNILVLNDDGRLVAKVADFGFAKLQQGGAETSSTAPANIYTAPEVLRCEQRPNEKGDVYSFGWVLLQMATGRLSKWHSDALDLEQVHAHKDQDLIDIVRTQCGPVLSLVEACWNQKWESRPSFEEIESRLLEILKDTPAEIGEEIRQYVDRHTSTIVYRVLDDEDIQDLRDKKGLIAGAPHNRVQAGVDHVVSPDRTLNEHVAKGTARVGRSGYISTSRSLSWTFYYVQRKAWLHGEHKQPRSTLYKFYPFVAIDLKKCGACKIVDLSSRKLTELKRKSLSVLARNFAAVAKEVVVVGDIPYNAVVGCYEINPEGPHGKSFTVTGYGLRHSLDREWLSKLKRENASFEPFRQWEAAFQNAYNIEDLESECKEAAKRNPEWPVPRNSQKTPCKRVRRLEDSSHEGKADTTSTQRRKKTLCTVEQPLSAAVGSTCKKTGAAQGKSDSAGVAAGSRPGQQLMSDTANKKHKPTESKSRDNGSNNPGDAQGASDAQKASRIDQTEAEELRDKLNSKDIEPAAAKQILKKLQASIVEPVVLRDSGIGRAVAAQKKNPDESVSRLAAVVKKQWRAMIDERSKPS